LAFNGSGVHNRVHDWTQDLTNTIPVTASRMDAEHDDISTALSSVICRDGQSTTTTRIPFAAGVSAAAGSTSAVAYAQTNDTNTGMYFPATDQWGLVAGGTAVLTGTASGVAATGTFGVTGDVTITGALAATGNITHHGQPIVPIGTIVDYAGSTEPNGWLFCYGQAVSRTTYADLFTALSTTYGVGDGSTTFNLPDCRGRVVAGQDDMGGSSANRLTNQSGGLNGDTLGAVGGSETHTLSTAESAAHTHTGTTASDGAHTHTTGSQAGQQAGGGVATNQNFQAASPGIATSSNGAHTHTFTSDSTGGGGAHNNVQPTIILNKIVYTGVYS
jgi:microcystin-dependent protein